MITVDRVKMIRRSIRCFKFGWIGLIPFLGLSMGWLALSLQRQIANETGDHWNLKPMHFSWACGMFLIAVCLWKELPNLAILATVVFFVLQFYLLHRQCVCTTPKEWNPARHLVYWGVELAYTGFMLTLGVLIVIGTIVLRNILG